MARIFSIEFTYNNALHHAMISVRETPFHTEYKITFLETDLTEFLPSDKIISPQPGNFIFANASPQGYNDLMNQLINSVAGHIHSIQQ